MRRPSKVVISAEVIFLQRFPDSLESGIDRISFYSVISRLRTEAYDSTVPIITQVTEAAAADVLV